MSLFDQYLAQRETSNKSLPERMQQSKSNKDERFWKPTFHKDTGTGYAVVRFLPGKDLAQLPYVKVYNHYFKGSEGGVYWEKSLTTIGQKDPVSELNSKLWATGDDKLKAKARDQKRRGAYISNVLVITDPDNPDAEGKVFLYQYGQKIFDKLQSALNPEFEDEVKVNAWDMINGASFKIKIKEVEKFQNYDSSSFDPNLGPVAPSNKEMEAIFNAQYDLNEFVDPANFKSYKELEANLIAAVGNDFPQFLGGSAKPAAPQQEKMSVNDFVAGAVVGASVASAVVESSGDEEDMSAFFNSLED